MAYPTIPYNASTGSDTSPSDTDGSGTNGDGTGTTLTLNETVDFTGVADDDSDYLWYDGNGTTDRHLFQVTAFNPSVAACTTITVAQSFSTTQTAKSWYVNGTRKTLEADTAARDPEDWCPGWIIEFEEGTYTLTAEFRPVERDTVVVADPPITIRAASGATSRPVIDVTGNNYYLIGGSNYLRMVLSGLKWTCSGTGGSFNYIYAQSSTQTLTMTDCVIDSANNALQCVLAGASSYVFRDCYFTGGTSYGILCDGNIRFSSAIDHCTFDGQGNTYFTTAAIYLDIQQAGLPITNCIIFDGDGDGIWLEGNTSAQSCQVIDGCLIVDNDGDGISIGSTVGTYPSQITMRNNIIAYNGAYGIADEVSGTNWYVGCDANAVYGNTSGNYSVVTAGPNAITLTADPFTDRGANDYTLNDTAGGGALLKGAAYPATMPDGA